MVYTYYVWFSLLCISTLNYAISFPNPLLDQSSLLQKPALVTILNDIFIVCFCIFLLQKSDLLANNRKFIKEGELFWKSARGRLTEVHVVIISDLLLLLSENNQKYTFASQDSKVITLNQPL